MRLILCLYFTAMLVKNGNSHPLSDPLFQNFDINNYYKVLKTGGIAEIDPELSGLNTARIPGKDAYIGALLMRKAGLLHKPKDKLDHFKRGRIALETALYSDSSNVEYRFLRLIIQEHAPKITKYRSQLAADSKYIRQHFKELPLPVQRVVRDYSQTSSVLHAADF